MSELDDRQSLVPEPGAPDSRDWTFVISEACAECGFEPSFQAPRIISDRIRSSIPLWKDVLYQSGAATRPTPTTWSAVEYSCHLRDLYLVFAGRFREILSHDGAQFADWDGEAAAITDRYWTQRAADVAEEIAASAEVVARILEGLSDADWRRTGTRSDGKTFTMLDLARYLLHEVHHHLHDLMR